MTESLLRDTRHAVRTLRRAPGFTAFTLLAAALGIALGVPSLSVIRATLPRPFLYTDQPGAEDGPGDWLASWSASAETIPQLQDAGLRALFWVLLALALLAVAVALVNAIALVLARATAREGEMAIRAALGAVARRLARQLLAEAVPLALPAVVAGALLGAWGVAWARRSWPTDTPPWRALPVDGGMLAVTVGVFFGAMLLGWLVPARIARRRDLHGSLGTAGRATAGRREGTLRRALVVGQFAASLVLLVGAGVLVRGFAASRDDAADTGPDPRGTLTLQLRLPSAAYAEPDRRAALFGALRERVGILPGVVDTSVSSPGAWVGLGTMDRVHALTGNPERPGVLRPARHHAVGPGFFHTLRVPLVSGREFTPADDRDAPRAVVVNRTFVYRFELAGNPVGKRIQLGRMSLSGDWYTIVGVVDDQRAPGVGSGTEPIPALYLSALQHPPGAVGFAVRTRGNPAGLALAIRRAIRTVDPRLVIGTESTLAEQLARFRAPLRWFAALFALLAALATLLAASGLYGVTTYAVERRTREIGVRMALGARARTIMGMVIRSGLRTIALGSALGLVAALPLARLLQLRFLGVDPLDPALYAGVTLLLGAVALAASIRPAARAARTDPMVALRAE